MFELTLTKGNKGFELQRDGNENWVMLASDGFSPMQSVAAAIGSCGGYVFQEVLVNSKIEAMIPSIKVSYERQEDHYAKPFKSIMINFFVKTTKENENKVLSAIKLVHKYCPVMLSMHPDIKIIESVTFV